MPLPDPKFDPRTYRDLLNEALARIPAHNPEWTNFNDSDPGITLLQLFAYLSESIIYRANRIPERNRQKFLRLLGQVIHPAQSAAGLVAFSNPRGPLQVRNLSPHLQLEAGQVPFRTENGVQVLPVEAQVYYKRPVEEESRRIQVQALYERLYASQGEPGKTFAFYETRRYEIPAGGASLPSIDLSRETEDGALWLALLARPVDDPDQARAAIAGSTLGIGIMPALDAQGAALYARGDPLSGDRPTLAFEIPKVNPEEERPRPVYRRLTARGDVDLLRHPGVAELTLPEAPALSTWTGLDPLEPGVGNFPPSLEDTAVGRRLLTWIRMRVPEVDPKTGAATRQLTAPLSWVGINAAKVVQRTRVNAEVLPAGNGDPDQSARLANTPVFPDSLDLIVNGEVWTRIDDLAAAPPEVPPRTPRLASDRLSSSDETTVAGPVPESADADDPSRVFAVDRESGEVRFGDGLRGRRPPAGASILASYDYGGGAWGNLGIGAIDKGSGLPPGTGIKVTNPVPTWGGARGETVAEAERAIPAYLRHRDRLVSREDFETIARRVPGIEVGRVEVLPLVDPDLPNQDAYGAVTLLVIPSKDPRQPLAPAPDRLFLDTLCRYLEPRRLITTELHVRAPAYKGIWVSLSIDVIPGYNEGLVREGVRSAVTRFLSPLAGGFEQRGWPLERAVDAAEIVAAAARVEGVASIAGVRLGDDTGEVALPIAMEGLELPRAMEVAVVSGTAAGSGAAGGETSEPPRIEELQGREPTRGAEVDSIPVPVIPESC